jgi:hypothetical protein
MRAPQVADFYTAAWPDFTPPLTLANPDLAIDRMQSLLRLYGA